MWSAREVSGGSSAALGGIAGPCRVVAADAHVSAAAGAYGFAVPDHCVRAAVGVLVLAVHPVAFAVFALAAAVLAELATVHSAQGSGPMPALKARRSRS